MFQTSFRLEKVWIRIDCVQKPLEVPYSGPNAVLQTTLKYFLIKTNDDVHTQVSVNRLTPFKEIDKQSRKTKRRNAW